MYPVLGSRDRHEAGFTRTLPRSSVSTSHHPTWPHPLSFLQANCTGRSEPHTFQLAWSNFLRHPNCPVASLDDSAAEMVGEVTMAPSAPPPSSPNLAESFLQITAISCRCLGGEVVGILETLFGLYSRNPVAKLGIRWESFKFAPFPTQLPLLCPLSHTVSPQCFFMMCTHVTPQGRGPKLQGVTCTAAASPFP